MSVPVKTPLETVQRAWNFYLAGDIEGLLALTTPDTVWSLENYEGWPDDAVYYGREGARRFITEWLAPWDRYESGVDELTEYSPDRVLALSWQSGLWAGSNVPVRMELAHITVIRDGLVARHEVWSDRDVARAAIRR